jgi:hypothetical protein
MDGGDMGVWIGMRMTSLTISSNTLATRRKKHYRAQTMQSSSFCVASRSVVSYRGDAYLTFTDCSTVDRAYVSVARSACQI